MQVSTCWTEETTLAQTTDILRGLALRQLSLQYFADSALPVVKQLRSLLHKRDYAGLCAFELDYTQDWDPFQLMRVRQALGFFTKLEDLDIGIDKEAAAFKTFEEGEAKCAATNRWLRLLDEGSVNLIPADARMLYAARRFIARVLGPCPEMERLPLRFGPGATASIKKSDACPQSKMAGRLECSSSFWLSGLLPSFIREVSPWLDCHAVSWWIDEEDYVGTSYDISLVPGKLEFVPKSAKTYRCIEKQPTLNTVLQAGIGRFISERLRLAGLDLRSNEANHAFAKIGSLDGSVATIDLSNASDTIATELVRFLLPADWFVLLKAARSGITSYKGQSRDLQKFSTMGNGFTFPLESLIFWALVRVASSDKRSVTVFGDDIICASSDYESVVHILTICGFDVNRNKSFSTGVFRESCGHDYYKGVNIRPYYQKHLVSGRTLFTAYNFFVRRGIADDEDEMAVAIRNLIPTPLRLYGPDGYGDGHLVSDTWMEKKRSVCVKRGWCGAFFETYSLEGRWIPSRYPGDIVTPLYTVYVKDRSDVVEQNITPVSGYLRLGVIRPELSDIGPTRPRKLAFGDIVDCQEVKTLNGRPAWDVPGTTGRYTKKLIYIFGASN